MPKFMSQHYLISVTPKSVTSKVSGMCLYSWSNVSLGGLNSVRKEFKWI